MLNFSSLPLGVGICRVVRTNTTLNYSHNICLQYLTSFCFLNVWTMTSFIVPWRILFYYSSYNYIKTNYENRCCFIDTSRKAWIKETKSSLTLITIQNLITQFPVKTFMTAYFEKRRIDDKKQLAFRLMDYYDGAKCFSCSKEMLFW